MFSTVADDRTQTVDLRQPLLSVALFFGMRAVAI
jgi:hypothetical protein